MKYHWDKVAMLLHVVNESRGHPKLDKMNKAAMAELEAMCEEPKEEPRPASTARPIDPPKVDPAAASEPTPNLPRL